MIYYTFIIYLLSMTYYLWPILYDIDLLSIINYLLSTIHYKLHIIYSILYK